ncbi:unnamed protein product [Periconia digitata]|uniref:Uncharacterized protein n=1 Tax=Periconia digitata TaxID=1303443 RepID=A0A9W4UN65_9PLEO|nr:unnamed protein product [Periconia digitata]
MCFPRFPETAPHPFSTFPHLASVVSCLRWGILSYLSQYTSRSLEHTFKVTVRTVIVYISTCLPAQTYTFIHIYIYIYIRQLMSDPAPPAATTTVPGAGRPESSTRATRPPLQLTASVNQHGNGNEANNGSDTPKPKPSRHIKLADHLQRPHLSAHRTLSDALRAERSREEQETLLGDDDLADADGCLRQDGQQPGPRQVFYADPNSALDTYYTIHRIRRLVIASIEDPYTMDQLKEPRMNVLIVKPLVDRLYDEEDISVVYCLLVNRMQFLREQHFQHHHQTVNLTRANLCELIAMKVLRRHDEEATGKQGLLLLAKILVAPFQPFQNAPPEVCPAPRQWQYNYQGGYEGKLTALEVAIVSESKTLLSGSACQKVIDAVYRGRVVYTPTPFLDILPDHYKHKPVSLYDPRKAPLLNQYRLIVPRTRQLIEVTQFIILLALYCSCMAAQHHADFTTQEALFIVYGAGWVMDECASMLEHGWTVHTQELWAFLDITFVIVYLAYSLLRIYAFFVDSTDYGRQALDLLAIAAPLLFPRLAFNLMPENMLFIALRAMVKEFTALSLIAVWCFGGFLLSLKWLSMGSPSADQDSSPNPITISKWMLMIWFGLDGTGIEEAPTFHEILGPALMVVYAFLGNTLFLTVLVSILSNTFSKIAADATSEIQFRRAVSTFEGVKSDSLFSYSPPFNILGLFVLLPLKFILSPRWFHKINITIIRVLNFPLLLALAVYERKFLWKPARKRALGASGLAKRKAGIWGWWGSFNVHAEIQRVFDEDPPEDVLRKIEDEDDLEDAILENSFAAMAGRSRSLSPGSASGVGARDGSVGGGGGVGWRRRRRLSTVVGGGFDVCLIQTESEQDGRNAIDPDASSAIVFRFRHSESRTTRQITRRHQLWTPSFSSPNQQSNNETHSASSTTYSAHTPHAHAAVAMIPTRAGVRHSLPLRRRHMSKTPHNVSQFEPPINTSIVTKRWSASPRPVTQKVPCSAKTIPGPNWLWLEPIYGPFRAYGRVQQRRPYMTQFVSALVIYLVGDLVAQSIGSAPVRDGEEEVEVEVDRGWLQAWGEDRDWARTARALFIGGAAAIPGYTWFLWLGNSFNFGSKVLSLTTKVTVNQLFFTPIFNSYFFGMQTILSGASLSETMTRIAHTVPTSWVNSCKFWPPVTAFMFMYVPLHYRSIFGGVIAIFWQAYLSILNQRAAVAEEVETGGEDSHEPISHVAGRVDGEKRVCNVGQDTA